MFVEGRPRSRRPVWEPSAWSRVLGFLKGGYKRVSNSIDFSWKGFGALARLLAIALSLATAIYSLGVLTRDVVIIEPISVPKQYVDAGITPEVMANKIKDALDEIEREAESEVRDTLSMRAEESSTPDVEIPGTKLGLKTVTEIVRTILPIFPPPKVVSGELILQTNSAGPDLSKCAVQLTIRIKAGETQRASTTVRAPVDDPTGAAQRSAEEILRQINPYVLGVYLLRRANEYSVIDMVQGTISDRSQSPKNVASAYAVWGMVLAGDKQHDNAIDKYKKAIDLDPKFASTYNLWGIILDEQGKYTEASRMFEKAIEVDAKYAWAYYNLGNVYGANKRYKSAVRQYKRALDLKKFEAAYEAWGRTLYAEKRYDEAIALLQKAVELTPKYASPYVLWGNVLAAQKSYEEANAKYMKATELDPSRAYAYESWGYALSVQKKYGEAVAKFQRATELDPKDAYAYNSWGSALYAQKKYDEAIAKFQRSAELDPKDALTYGKWGNVLFAQQRFAQAVAKYEKAAELDPKNERAEMEWDEIQGRWGRALQQLGKEAEAQQKFAKARELEAASKDQTTH